MSITEDLIHFAQIHLNKLGRAKTVTAATNIRGNDDFDSLFVIELTLFIERTFALDLRKHPLETAHLTDFAALARFLEAIPRSSS